MGAVMAKEGRNKTDNATSSIPITRPIDLTEDQKTKNLQEISARVDRVNFDGVSRTKERILKHSVQDLFCATNFEEVIRKSHEAKTRLQGLGLFRTITIYIDTSSGPKSTTNGYEVTFQVTELRRYSGGVTSQVSNNEGVLVVGAYLPNFGGNGEMIKGQYSYGSRKSNSLGLTLSKPFFLKTNPLASLSLFSNACEWPISGYKVKDTGCLLDLCLFSTSALKHNLQYELNWRHTVPSNRYSSFEVVQEAGHKLKSCVRHILTCDKRDNPIFPSTGTYFKFDTELSGLAGNIKFLKNEGSYQFNYPLFRKDVIFQLGLNAGHLLNFGDAVSLPDNFYLGGPLSLRGFDTRAVGPQKDGNFLGGKMFYAAALHLYTPLPFKPGSPGFGEIFRTHLWMNAGRVGDFKSGDFDKFLKDQFESLRVTFGVGIALRLGHMARIECNLCFPLLASESDHVIKPVQWGVGVHFL